MNPELVFIADLHLNRQEHQTFADFYHLLERLTGKAKKLYILGDLFDKWRNDRIEIPLYTELVNKTLHAQKRGLKIYFMPGNRDFMLGKKFAKLAGITILPDPYLLIYNQQRVILTHGDKLCTDDKKYQTMRKVLQNRTTKFIFNRLPELVMDKITKTIKKGANQSKTAKASNITDVNQQAIDNLIHAYEADILIHGHTHKPGQYRHNTRFVVGDWQQEESRVLVLDQTGFVLSRSYGAKK